MLDRSPPVERDLRKALVVFAGHAPRIVRRPLRAGEGAVEDERRRALGIRSREQQAHRAALRDAHQHGALGAPGVHDRAHVVHPRLEVGRAGYAIRKTGAALVEDEHARDPAERAQERRLARHLPLVLDMRDEPGDVDEVDGAVPEHLIGDRHLAAARIARLRDLHAPIVTAAIGERDLEDAAGGLGRLSVASTGAQEQSRVGSYPTLWTAGFAVVGFGEVPVVAIDAVR
jgi:hypothetical protein